MGATIAMIAGDCFDLNISVVMRERFKATRGPGDVEGVERVLTDTCVVACHLRREV